MLQGDLNHHPSDYYPTPLPLDHIFTYTKSKFKFYASKIDFYFTVDGKYNQNYFE
jgi:hypothetical protein